MATNIVERVRGITADPDFASQLTALISEQSLTDDQARSLFKTLDLQSLEAESAYINSINDVAKYEGFNPREIIKMLLISHGSAKRRANEDPGSVETVETRVMVDGVMSDFTFSSNQSFDKDMQFICLMFITRGAAFDKIVRKSSDAMKDCLRLMRIKYNINTTTRRPGQSLDSKTITTPRIAASFPSITVGLFHRGFGRTIYDINSLFPDVELPRALFSPMMPSMLPKTTHAPLAVMLCLAVKTDDILHQTTNKTTLTALFQYLLASYNSVSTTETLKIKYCTTWGIGDKVNGDFIYKTAIKDLKVPAKAIIRNLRPNDTEIENILERV